MKKVAPGLYAFLLLLSFSCSDALFDGLSRTIDDPIVIPPTVDSFSVEGKIILSWPVDLGADEYILERSPDVTTESFVTVYRGRQTEFIDTTVSLGDRVVYRLTKTRGSRLFGPSIDALGVSSSVRRDSNEPNDTVQVATPMGTFVEANTYFYCSNGGEELSDWDWYSLSVPARTRASISVTMDLPAGSTQNYLNYYKTGSTAVAVTNGTAITIENAGYEQRTFTFALYPYDASYVGADGTGGMVMDYTVKLEQLVFF